jgi:hypothetical protein
MKKNKYSSAEVMSHLSSYAHLGHCTHYDRITYGDNWGFKFNELLYQTTLTAFLQDQLTMLIQKRVSSRTFSGESIAQKELQYLLFNSYSLKSAEGSFTIPQAGGLPVMSLYILENKLNYWQLCQYDPVTYNLSSDIDKLHLEEIFYTKSTDFQAASHAVIIASQLNKFADVYLARAFKFACIQAGHIAQNIILTAINKKLRAITLGCLMEDEIIRLCHFKVGDFPLYGVLLGK